MELQQTALVEQAAYQDMIGRASCRVECHVPGTTTHLGQGVQRTPGVDADHGREGSAVACEYRSRLRWGERVPDGLTHRTKRDSTGRCEFAGLCSCRAQIDRIAERQRAD